MQRTTSILLLAALALSAGCAPRDPNLAVRGLGEFSRQRGDYTLKVSTFELDADGRVRLAGQGDPSLSGFVTRSLAPKGYELKTAGPARYAVEVHLLCANTREAKKGFAAEELRIPAELVGQGHAEQVHYWLPDRQEAMGSRETLDLRDAKIQGGLGGPPREARNALGGAPFGRTTPEHCQGRVLVTVTPEGKGPAREVFVGRSATEDCRAVAGCPVSACRSALEQSLVDLLERRF